MEVILSCQLCWIPDITFIFVRKQKQFRKFSFLLNYKLTINTFDSWFWKQALKTQLVVWSEFEFDREYVLVTIFGSWWQHFHIGYISRKNHHGVSSEFVYKSSTVSVHLRPSIENNHGAIFNHAFNLTTDSSTILEFALNCDFEFT